MLSVAVGTVHHTTEVLREGVVPEEIEDGQVIIGSSLSGNELVIKNIKCLLGIKLISS